MESKLPATGTTIFAVMSALSIENDAINLSQGFPGFNPDQALLDRVSHYLNSGANQYAPMPGLPALCNAIAAKVGDLYGRKIDPPAEVTVCDGATEGLFSAIQAVVHGGDEVIVFDPAYDSYEPSVALAGGSTVHIPLVTTADNPDFHIDWDRVRDTINERTRLIIVNFPHNPTGVILSAADLESLAEVVRRTCRRSNSVAPRGFRTRVPGPPPVSSWRRSAVRKLAGLSALRKALHEDVPH